MEVKTTSIPGVLLLTPRYFHDARGYFVETYNARSARDAGLVAEFVQDNQALSLKRGTVRALHFQVPPQAQGKLVRVLRGSVYDVAVDIARRLARLRTMGGGDADGARRRTDFHSARLRRPETADDPEHHHHGAGDKAEHAERPVFSVRPRIISLGAARSTPIRRRDACHARASPPPTVPASGSRRTARQGTGRCRLRCARPASASRLPARCRRHDRRPKW